MQDVLEIRDLYARVPEKEILKGVNLTIKTGETHAIMGLMVLVSQLYLVLLWVILNMKLLMVKFYLMVRILMI